MRNGAKPIFYVIGDSHVSFFSGRDAIIPLWPDRAKTKFRTFKLFRIGAALAYSVGKHDTSYKTTELIEFLTNRSIPDQNQIIPKGSNIIFCFGEIDCRAHILKQKEKQGESENVIISNLVSGYVDYLKRIKDIGFNVWIWNVIPTSSDSNNPIFPAMGTEIERNIITRKFNQELELASDEYDIGFLSIYESLYDDNTYKTIQKYFFDKTHLGQNAWGIFENEFKSKTGCEIFKNSFFCQIAVFYEDSIKAIISYFISRIYYLYRFFVPKSSNFNQ